MTFFTKCLIISGIIIGGIFLLAKQGGRNAEKIDQNKSGNNDDLLASIKSEPKVKDAVITDANVLYVSVIDDETNRNGYAEYICEVVKDFNTNVNRVKVVKYNSSNDSGSNAYGTVLGQSWCK